MVGKDRFWPFFCSPTFKETQVVLGPALVPKRAVSKIFWHLRRPKRVSQWLFTVRKDPVVIPWGPPPYLKKSDWALPDLMAFP